jgi:hypothetical protein
MLFFLIFQKMSENSDFKSPVSSFTYKKRQRQLNANFQQQTDLTQTDRIETDRKVEDGNKFPPPDDNDLLQLEKKINQTNLDQSDLPEYEEYFDYMEGAGLYKPIIH